MTQKNPLMQCHQGIELRVDVGYRICIYLFGSLTFFGFNTNPIIQFNTDSIIQSLLS